MRYAGLLIVVWLAGAAPGASAAGFNLNWGPACFSDAPSRLGPLLTSACSAEADVTTMTVSFMADKFGNENPSVTGFRIMLAGLADELNVLPWWQLGVGECRAGALSIRPNVQVSPDGLCLDAWQGQATATYAYRDGAAIGWDRLATLTIEGALQAPVVLDSQDEYVACQIAIDHRQTVGADACGECDSPMLWAITRFELICEQGTQEMEHVVPNGNFCLRWQGDIHNMDCWFFVPPVTAQQPTWGRLKSMYR